MTDARNRSTSAPITAPPMPTAMVGMIPASILFNRVAEKPGSGPDDDQQNDGIQTRPDQIAQD